MTLAGTTVLLTRPAGRDTALAALLARAGASVLHAPAIRFEAVETTVPPGPWDWLAVTSPTAAERLPDGAAAHRVAALGDGTRRALLARGVAVDLVADLPTGEGLARSLIRAGAGPGTHVLHPTSDRTRPELRATLEAAGVDVTVLTTYRTLPAPIPTAVADRATAGGIDAVVLASPSAVAALVEGLPPAAADRLRAAALAVAIGPTTAAALREAGFARVTVAARPAPDAILDILVGKETP